MIGNKMNLIKEPIEIDELSEQENNRFLMEQDFKFPNNRKITIEWGSYQDVYSEFYVWHDSEDIFLNVRFSYQDKSREATIDILMKSSDNYDIEERKMLVIGYDDLQYGYSGYLKLVAVINELIEKHEHYWT